MIFVVRIYFLLDELYPLIKLHAWKTSHHSNMNIGILDLHQIQQILENQVKLLW